MFVMCEDDDNVAEIQKLNQKFMRLELLSVNHSLTHSHTLSLPSLCVYHTHSFSFLQSCYLSFHSLTLTQSLCMSLSILFISFSLYLSLSNVFLSLYLSVSLSCFSFSRLFVSAVKFFDLCIEGRRLEA